MHNKYVILPSCSGQAALSTLRQAGEAIRRPRFFDVLSWSWIMSAIRILSATAITLAALASHAQEGAVPRPEQDGSSMTSVQCAAARKARHDHGIERGHGPMPIKGCGSKSSTMPSATGARGHHHGSFHKNR
jgi:hypothetical protein